MVIRDGRFKSKALSLCLILGVLATGCDESKEASVEEHLKRAQELLKTADFRGSVVELKNVLQADPNNADARLILSQLASVRHSFDHSPLCLRARARTMFAPYVTATTTAPNT